MVEKKPEEQGQSLMEFIVDEAKKYKALPVVDERWSVIEHTPGYNESGYYDHWVSAKSVRVSEYFNNKWAADEWMDKHIPSDPRGKLYVLHEKCREKVVREWGTI